MKMTDDEKTQIVDLRKSGKKIHEICAEVNRTSPSVWKVLKENGMVKSRKAA